jgi:hypothetical protein
VERRTHYGEPLCQHVPGSTLDAFVTEQVLLALEPAALELALAAAEQVEQERTELDRLWQQRLERARYEAERVARQYRLAEPENRLVMRQLEREWEEKLAAQQRLAEEYHRCSTQHPRVLPVQERDAIRRLATAIPGLWTATTTTVTDRKEIIRQVVERVVVAVQGRSERVTVVIEWAGGGHTDGEMVRDIARLCDLSYYAELCARVRALTAAGLSAPTIAAHLRDEGYRPPRQAARFGFVQVAELQRRLGLRPSSPRVHHRPPLNPEEWWSPDLAARLGLSRATLHRWMRLGWVRARQEEGPLHRWIVWADSAELARLEQLRQRSVADAVRQRWIGTTDTPETSAATIGIPAISTTEGGA